MLNAVQKSLFIVAILIIASISAEEIETRKTVKKSAAIKLKNYMEAQTDATQTADIEIVQNTSTQLTTVINKPSSTTTQQSLSNTRSIPMTIRPTLTTFVMGDEVTTEKQIEATTMLPVISSSPEPILSTTDSIISITDLENDSKPDESDIGGLLPFKDPPKRKVIYINQQQNGKLNVHLELSDVSLIVIPNQKDQNQLSLLNLLFKSAQKSKIRNESEEKKKINSVDHDDYSKYKETFKPTDDHLSSGNIPFVESRAPYKVDISSTLDQSQPAVDINANSRQSLRFQTQFERSPMMQLLQPVPYALSSGPWSGQTPPSERIFKRSIDSRLHSEVPNDFDNYNKEDELTETILNSLENNYSYGSSDDSEFILLGAIENCGPGRKRNSYQICVSVEDME